ncbi:MAG: DUF433 domain-containing protein, partial [Bacteroidetes bacterium]
MLADDVSIEEILQEYKGLERADILACLAYNQNPITSSNALFC